MLDKADAFTGLKFLFYGRRSKQKPKSLLTIFRFGIASHHFMWQIESTQQWDKDRKWYEKKRPAELAAVLHNLKRYVLQLESAPNPKAFTAGYMHHEPHGVVAID